MSVRGVGEGESGVIRDENDVDVLCPDVNVSISNRSQCI